MLALRGLESVFILVNVTNPANLLKQFLTLTFSFFVESALSHAADSAALFLFPHTEGTDKACSHSVKFGLAHSVKLLSLRAIAEVLVRDRGLELEGAHLRLRPLSVRLWAQGKHPILSVVRIRGGVESASGGVTRNLRRVKRLNREASNRSNSTSMGRLSATATSFCLRREETLLLLRLGAAQLVKSEDLLGLGWSNESLV